MTNKLSSIHHINQHSENFALNRKIIHKTFVINKMNFELHYEKRCLWKKKNITMTKQRFSDTSHECIWQCRDIFIKQHGHYSSCKMNSIFTFIGIIKQIDLSAVSPSYPAALIWLKYC